MKVLILGANYIVEWVLVEQQWGWGLCVTVKGWLYLLQQTVKIMHAKFSEGNKML